MKAPVESPSDIDLGHVVAASFDALTNSGNIVVRRVEKNKEDFDVESCRPGVLQTARKRLASEGGLDDNAAVRIEQSLQPREELSPSFNRCASRVGWRELRGNDIGAEVNAAIARDVLHREGCFSSAVGAADEDEFARWHESLAHYGAVSAVITVICRTRSSGSVYSK